MSSTSLRRDDRQWFYLGIRHLRIASRLLRMKFVDAAVFHSYHGYECILSALIAAKGYPVPPDGWTKLTLPTGKTVRAYPSPLGTIQDHNSHKARVVLFDELADRSKPYFAHHQSLKTFLTYQIRLDSLYYDPTINKLPQQRYSESFAQGLLPNLQQFTREVRVDVS